MFNKIKRWLLRQFQDNFIICFIVTIVLIIGIIAGSVTIKMLDIEQKNKIITFLNSFFKTLEGQKLGNLSILKQSIIDNFKTIALIWLTGTISLGLFIIPLIVLFRGFAIGFTVGFLINEYGLRGLLFSTLGILPHNLLIIPSILLISSIGIILSIEKVRRRDLSIKNRTWQLNTVNYSILVLFFSTFILIGCLIESYISPIFLKLLSNYLK